MACSDCEKQHSLTVQECHSQIAQLRSQIIKHCGVSNNPADVYKSAGKSKCSTKLHQHWLSILQVAS